MKTTKININDINDNILDEPKIKAKNIEKLELLKKMDLTKYDPYMIKLLLDGDYKDELYKYKVKIYMFIADMIENKIKHCKFGINTILYKMVKDYRKGEPLEKYFNRRKKEPESEYETTDDECDEEEFIKQVINISKTDKKKAYDIINYNLTNENPLYNYLISKIK